MTAPKENISVKSSYNVGGISFTPKQIAEEIKNHIPEFKISYKPDFRQPIADSWPQSINDSVAQKDWGLETKYDIKALTEVMLNGVKEKFYTKK